MKKTLRENKGVTLVSLVVTVIVLIILASISLNIVIGKDGIITVAQRAKENIELAQREEESRLNKLYEQMGNIGEIEGTEYDAIAKLAEYKEKVAAAITEKGVPTEKTDSTQTMAENIAKISQGETNEIKLDKTSITIYIGKTETLKATVSNVTWSTMNSSIATVENGIVTGVAAGNTMIIVTDNDTGKRASCKVSVVAPENPLNIFKAGDYIKYDTGVTTVGENGVVMCSVLYPLSSSYGLQIVTNEELNKVKLGAGNYWQAIKSYNDVVTLLNTQAEQYLNPDYAIDARSIGSNPANKNDDTTYYVSLSFYNAAYVDNPAKEKDSRYVTDINALDAIGKKKLSFAYWLPSRNLEKTSTYAYFYVRAVRFFIRFYNGCAPSKTIKYRY